MKRREFITLVGGAAAWPLAARAQQARVRRVAALIAHSETAAIGKSYAGALEQGLTARNWTIGGDLAIDYRWDIADPQSARAATTELLQRSPDIILAHAIEAMDAVQQATHTVPVVFTGVSEPITHGYVASFARPGGNVTGFTNIEPSVAGKLVELLRDIAPRTARVASMFSRASDPVTMMYSRQVEAAAKRFGLSFVAFQVQEPVDIETAIERVGAEPGSALVFPPDTFVSNHHQLVVDLTSTGYYAAKSRQTCRCNNPTNSIS